MAAPRRPGPSAAIPMASWRPFWMHQLAEYVIGLSLVASGLQSPEPWWPVIVGGVIVVNAAIVDGPLGAWRTFRRLQHRRIDLILIIATLVVAVLPFLAIDNMSRLLLGVAALVWFVVWRGSSYETASANRGRRRATRVAAASNRSDDLGRRAGRLVNQGRAYWKQRQQQRE